VCFGSLLQFYDGLCSWEEESSTPVLHIGWVKPIVKSFAAFDFSVRTRLDISCLQEEGKGGLVALAGWDAVPDRLNNNYKESADDCDRDCDEGTGHYDISLYKVDFIYDLNLNNSHHPRATKNVSFEDFHGMHVSRLVRLAATGETDETLAGSGGCALDSSKQRLLNQYADRAGDSLLNIDFLLGGLDSEPFLALTSPGLAPPGPASPPPARPSTKAASLAVAGGRLPAARLAKNGRVKVTLFSAKIGDLKPLLQCEKLNSSALHLHLTAQSQTDVKKSRLGLETDLSPGGRVKRPRRE
jgi:menin